MKPELAEFIQRACDNADTFFKWSKMPDVREFYIGRGNITPTTAIVADSLFPVMAAIAMECFEMDPEDEECNAYDIAKGISCLRKDSMGNRIVIY